MSRTSSISGQPPVVRIHQLAEHLHQVRAPPLRQLLAELGVTRPSCGEQILDVRVHRLGGVRRYPRRELRARLQHQDVRIGQPRAVEVALLASDHARPRSSAFEQPIAVGSPATMWTLHDAPGKEVREVPAAPGAPSVAEHHGATADRSELAAAAADPVIAELEAALAMRLAGADARVLRRVLSPDRGAARRVASSRCAVRRGLSGWSNETYRHRWGDR